MVPINPVPSEGVRFNALLATFTDTNPNPKPGEFSAKIFWGDGTSSAAFILPDQSAFDVRGSHLWPTIALRYAGESTTYAATPAPGRDRLFSGGEELLITGGAGPFALAGRTRISAPVDVVVTRPDLTLPLHLPTATALDVAWVGEGAE